MNRFSRSIARLLHFADFQSRYEARAERQSRPRGTTVRPSRRPRRHSSDFPTKSRPSPTVFHRQEHRGVRTASPAAGQRFAFSRNIRPLTSTKCGVELLRAVTFCTEIEYVKCNSLVGLGHKVAFCSVSDGDEITLYGIAFPASVCIASHN